MVLRPHHVSGLYRTFNYIERNLGRRPSLTELAKVASLAPHYFHRTFSAATGESVQGHVRRLQLERAGFELFTSDRAIAEIAIGCGYQSPAGFARAFGRHYGVSAQRFRKVRNSASLIAAIPPELRRNFAQLSVRLRDEPDRRLKFIRRTGPLLPLRIQGREVVRRLLTGTSASQNAPIYKQTPDFPPITAPDKLRHDFAFSADVVHHASDELIETRSPGGKYAVFYLDEGEVPEEVILHLWSYVYLVWAPENGMRILPFGAYELWRRRDGRLTGAEIHVQVQRTSISDPLTVTEHANQPED